MPDLTISSVPIICGPTGSGKSTVAMRLAEQYPIEIISADSRQIIKQLEIGTAKPSTEDRRRVRIHLLDLIDLGDRYSAMRFIADASAAIKDICDRGRVPVVVGGTGLYLRALTDGVVEIETADMAIRERLEEEANSFGTDLLWYRLNQIDPLEAAKIHPNNRIRLIRALEIFYISGKTKSEITATGAYRKSPWSFVYHCIDLEREALYNQINRRAERMIAEGMLDEVGTLCAAGWRERLEIANVIGYKEVIAYLDRRMSLEEATAILKQNHRRYAKRQMTWFRHQASCHFYSDLSSLEREVGHQIASFMPDRR